MEHALEVFLLFQCVSVLHLTFITELVSSPRGACLWVFKLCNMGDPLLHANPVHARRVDLVSDVLQDTPEAQGRLLIDLINEPDGYSLTWEVRGHLRTCLPLSQGKTTQCGWAVAHPNLQK